MSIADIADEMTGQKLPLLLFLFVGGCGTAATGPLPVDAGRDLFEDGPHLIDGGACSTTIDEVEGRALSPAPGPACPARFDDVRDRGSCGSFTNYRVGPCGGAFIYAGGCGMDQFVCAYDASSRLLVGMATSTDTNAYCNASSSCLMGGVLPAEIVCGKYGLSASACVLDPLRPDGGENDADSATDGGGDGG